MAALLTHDVVKEAQSVSAQSLTGEIATLTESAPAVRALPLESQASSVEATADALDITNGEPEASDETTLNGPPRDLSRSPYSKEALADASGGSDTDTSKPDGAISKEDAAGHLRTNSFKKPISFKSVSVTKNFLAKANVPQTSTRTGEKGALSGQSSPLGLTLKPRLVAKSALGGLSSRSNISGGTGPINSPDASKVWNKNRPPPPPVPRNYTDEELKQQYGIHMATRLGADDDGKEAKWADIDDDEDDWAPETVTWLDGTKSSVAPTDAKPIELEQAQSNKQIILDDAPTSGERPRLQLQKQSQPSVIPVVETILSASPHPKTPVLASTKTILKPGSHALAQKSAGSNSKPSEKQVPAVVGSPAPVPAKSPWAALPPVDKASPVSFVPPPSQQQPSQRFSRDPSGFDGFQQTTPLSPQEIEADDFHRFHNHPRRKELFNSQSGEFEPANDARKHQGRHEQHGHRQPAVLQRSGPGQSSPAEPSPSFQSHRTGLEGSQWQRQRAGSNSSAGRRMSFSKLHGEMSARPEAVQEVLPSVDSAIIEDEVSHSNEAQTSPMPQINGQPEPDAAAFMRESIEKARLAKQLRMQEEEQEEKARKERLRLKMAALAPAVSPAPTEDTEPPKSAKSTTRSPHLTKATQVVASPPKPPVPTAKGEVAQYGLMKVHQSQPVKSAAATDAQHTPRGNVDHRLGRKQSNSNETTPQQRFEPTSKPSPGVHDVSPQTSDQVRPAAVPESSPWRPAGPPPEGINGWGSSNSSNVWGPPQSKAKALGNGTFDNSGFRTIQGTAQGTRSAEPSASFNTPGPIGPPSGQLNAHSAGRSLPAHIDRAHGPHGEISPPNSLGHGEAQNFAHSPHRNYQQPSRGEHVPQDKMSHAIGGPVRQPHSVHDTTKVQSVPSGWNSMVSANLEESQQARRDWQQQQQNFDMKSIDRPTTPVYGKLGPMDSRRTMLASEGPQTRIENFSNDKLSNGNITLPGQIGLSPQGLSSARATALATSVPSQSSATLTQRPSRFFPRNEAVEQTDKSNSPPPPETSSLDTGAALQSPRVNIPKVAIVKLPPPLTPSTPSQVRDGPMSMPSNTSAGSARGDWQSKFNTLFKVHAPTADAVATSSRAPLEQVFSHGAAAVSLPARAKPITRPLFSTDKSPYPQSRRLDDDLYPQPEFGSTPTIRFPPKSHDYRMFAQFHAPYKAHNPMLIRELRDAEASTAFSTTRLEQLEFTVPSRQFYIVRLSKDAVAKTVVSNSSVQRSFNLRGGFKERRSNLESPANIRGGKRNGAPYASRDSGTGSLRGNPNRGNYRGGSSFTSKRNITAPAASQ